MNRLFDLVRQFAIAVAVLATPFAGAPLLASGTQSRLVEAAQREGSVVVYSVLSSKAAQPLIRDFEALYPGIKVHYDGESGSNDMDARFRRERKEGLASADVVWSSAMDMQMQLVKEGFAASYRSTEARNLPRWANYKGLAYGTTLEPVVFVYNKQQLSGSDIPQDHDALVALLDAQPDRFQGKVTGFDLRKSGVGFMFAVQDQANYPRLDALLASFGSAGFAPSGGTGDMLIGINEGKYLLGYNMMGAYAQSRSRKDLPNLGVVFPKDYTLALSRIILLNRAAAHPNAARLWLDYTLSARGQKVLGDAMELYPIRDDVEATYTASGLRGEIGKSLRPIPIDMRLTDALEPTRHAALIEAWSTAIGAAATSAPIAAIEPTRLVVVVDGITALRNFPVLLAEKLGYLKTADYSTTLMDIRPDIDIDEMVADGSVDASIAYWHHAAAMHAAGKPMAAVVTMGVTPGAKLMVANQLRGQVRTLADLKGKRIIAGGPYSAKTTVANAAVMAGGLSPADYVRFAPEDAASSAAMLRGGKADLIVARTPDGSYYEQQGVASLFADLTSPESTTQWLGTLFPTNAVYMTQARIDADPAAAQHLATAFVKTLAWLRSHSAEDVAALMPKEVIGNDRAAYVRAVAESMAMYQNDGRMPVGAAEAELKVLQAVFPPYAKVRAEQTYTNKFVDQAISTGIR